MLPYFPPRSEYERVARCRKEKSRFNDLLFPPCVVELPLVCSWTQDGADQGGLPASYGPNHFLRFQSSSSTWSLPAVFQRSGNGDSEVEKFAAPICGKRQS